MDKEIEPPALKIRIFKRHSGELINDNEAKHKRKRQKKIIRKSKLSKMTSNTGNAEDVTYFIILIKQIMQIKMKLMQWLIKSLLEVFA